MEGNQFMITLFHKLFLNWPEPVAYIDVGGGIYQKAYDVLMQRRHVKYLYIKENYNYV